MSVSVSLSVSLFVSLFVSVCELKTLHVSIGDESLLFTCIEFNCLMTIVLILIYAYIMVVCCLFFRSLLYWVTD